jgi:hypothetical protein
MFMQVKTPGTSTIALCGNALLRIALRRNLVTFPSQVPAFAKPPVGQMQRGAAQLYFVRGWTMKQICLRYGLRKKIVQNLLSDWRLRAVSAGLIQEIQSEDLSELLLEQQMSERDGNLPPFLHTMDTPGSVDLMSAFREDLVELGVELSSEQLRRIERIVRDVTPARPAHEVRPGNEARPGNDAERAPILAEVTFNAQR